MSEVKPIITFEFDTLNQIIEQKIAEALENQQNSDYGKNWSMKEFMSATGRSRGWLKKHFLDSIEFQKLYSIEYGGFVYYPESDSTGGEYLFKVSGARDFIENDMYKWKEGTRK